MKESTTVNLACSFKRCSYRITLQVETDNAFPFGLQGTHYNEALQQAACYLGWRQWSAENTSPVTVCPFHAKDLRCKRCLNPTHECSCMGGPRWEAIS